MADKEKKSGWGQQMMDRAMWASKNSRGRSLGSLGPMMAMMGIPWQQRAPGGDWMTIDPGQRAIYPRGSVLPPAASSAATSDTAASNATAARAANNGLLAAASEAPPPDTLGKLGKVDGFPQWYIDWYKSQGMYGGVPPVEGLL